MVSTLDVLDSLELLEQPAKANETSDKTKSDFFIFYYP
ncbi:hypothetical protein X781_3330 [Mannheimia sp. USDA-ARS-USMARC-1261]|nr:hypothetical protein X781_3330 [Mannheimia sp. USDA-ARS-USMARC-1261]